MPTRKRLLLYKHSIGEVLRAWRLERKLSQDKLGELSGYLKGYLSRVENDVIGQPDDEHLCKLAKALDIPKEYFRDRILPKDVLLSKQKESEEANTDEKKRSMFFAAPIRSPQQENEPTIEELQSKGANTDEKKRPMFFAAPIRSPQQENEPTIEELQQILKQLEDIQSIVKKLISQKENPNE